MNGWIKIHNKFLKWEWYAEPNMVALWVHLLLKANWKDSRYKGSLIKRGQLVVGRKALAQQTGFSEQQIRTYLTRLKSTNEITITSTNKFSIITIVKWEEYQGKENNSTNTSTSNPPNEQPTNNQQITTSKEYKTIRIKDSIGRFTPPTPEEVKAYCQERNNGVDSNKWHNFYSAKGWMVGKNKMKDWRAAVRTWEEKKVVSYTQAKELPKVEEISEAQRLANMKKLNEMKRGLKFNVNK